MDEQPSFRLPFYIRLTCVLLMLTLIAFILNVGKDIVTPLILSLLFAILLRPVVRFFNKRLKLPHVIAVILAVFLFLLFVLSIIAFITWQVSDFVSDWPKIKENLNAHYSHIQHWIRDTFNISYVRQEKYIQKVTQDSMESGKDLVGTTLSSFSDMIFNILLIPVFTFLILLYRNLFIKFLCRLVSSDHHATLGKILSQVKVAIQSYVVGLLTEMLIVSVLTASGLMIIGVDYALLLGVITGILNLIPYVGIIIAAVISMIAALINSTELSSVMGVVIVNVVVQLIDNNILVPNIVGSKVRINALASIVGVIIGGALGGVAGMFLAIPIIAILKVIFDHIDSMKPWGMLMSDELPQTFEWFKLRFPDFGAGANDDTPPGEKENTSEKL